MVPCRYKRHSQKYGVNDHPATILVRSTCIYCDRYRVYEVCDECFEGVRGSGLPMECGRCGRRMTTEQKLAQWVRIGDV